MNTPSSTQPNRSFYDRISRTYDLIADAGEHAARETGERLLDVRSGERVLEIGFGTGNSTLTLAKAVGDEGRVCGIDISDGMRDVAQAKVVEAGVTAQVELLVGDARTLPYEIDSFDSVFMSFTLELFALEDIPIVLAEVRRVLRNGGRVGIVSMSRVADGESESILERTYIWMHRHFPHIVDCQPIDVERSLSDSDFRIADKRVIEIWTMPVVAAVGVK